MPEIVWHKTESSSTIHMLRRSLLLVINISVMKPFSSVFMVRLTMDTLIHKVSRTKGPIDSLLSFENSGSKIMDTLW